IGMIPILIAMLLAGQDFNKWKWPIGGILALLNWALIVTFSRGAWISLLISVVCLWLLMYRTHQLKTTYFMCFFGFFAVTASLIYFANDLKEYTQLFSMNRMGAVQWRIGIWKTAWGMFIDRPLFGHGINTFMTVYQGYRENSAGSPTYAHNVFIQIAAETGILGIGSFLWLLVALLRETQQQMKRAVSKGSPLVFLLIGLSVSMAALLIHANIETSFYHLQLSAYIWFLIGILIALNNYIKNHLTADEVI
ncbi:MAG: O-antigen ligase family protein, partial [Candidatus Omnitrophica bacterium]|nr:O-antigen ligase family protein [Candidatus Omnitrophota bacterium]